MATKTHCAFCFETLAANLERRQALSLDQVQGLWEQYHATKSEGATATSNRIHEESKPVEDEGEGGGNGDDVEEEDAEMTDADADAEESSAVRPAAISRLLGSARASSATSSNTSLHSSTQSSSSSSRTGKDASGTNTPASSSSSRSSLFSPGRKGRDPSSEFPLFVTWNTVSRSGHKSLRGCIGTFEAQELEYGLRSYALTSAFEDVRFQPIPLSQLSSLSNHVTLLTNFSAPSKDPMDWTVGRHGLRIAFNHHGRRLGSTYLPEVAREQGWTKEETLISLMRKAGWTGSSSGWERTWRDGRGELVTYEGQQEGLHYAAWREWRDWVDTQGTRSTS